jgi:hypothetical protein
MTEIIKIHINKSEIPIIWLDTSIITSMTTWRLTPSKLEPIQQKRIGGLYENIYKYVGKGKLICPLAEQEGEVWIERNKWHDTINQLSLGIKTLTLQEIQDNQFYAAMEAYVSSVNQITFSYKDAFDEDPVKELKSILKHDFAISVHHQIIFGEDYQRKLKNKYLTILNSVREKNVKKGNGFEQQLEAEIVGELNAMLMQLQMFLSNNFKDDEEQFNATYGVINLHKQFAAWEQLTGKSMDFIELQEFYGSPVHREIPYIKLSCNLMAHLMTDKQPIRSGDVMDVKHVSTLMPFSDLFITDKAMSRFLKKQKFDTLYNTTVCYVGDSEEIENFFSNL